MLKCSHGVSYEDRCPQCLQEGLTRVVQQSRKPIHIQHADAVMEYENLTKDAKRYRWLREQDTDSNTGLAIADRLNEKQGYFLSGVEADEAIDAAISQTKQEGNIECEENCGALGCDPRCVKGR